MEEDDKRLRSRPWRPFRQWGLGRLVLVLCLAPALPWLLAGLVIANFTRGLQSGFSSWPLPIAFGALSLMIYVVCLVGYASTVALLLSRTLAARLKEFGQWADRIIQLHDGSASEEDLPEAHLLGRTMRDVIIRAHRTSLSYRFLNTINQRISSSMQLEVILPEIVESAVQLLGATAGSFTLCDKSGNHRRVALYNLPEEMMRAPVVKSLGLTTETIQRAKPVIIDDYSVYPRRLALLDGHGFKAGIGVPLLDDGQVIGSLAITTADASRRFGQADVELLSSFARQAVIAIKNAELHSENLHQMEELRHTKRQLAERALQFRKLLTKTLRSEDENRSRIAVELHDGITQLIVGALCQIQSARPKLAAGLPAGQHENLKGLDLAQGLLKQTVDEMYYVIHDLRPPYIDDMGLIPALERYLRSFREVSGIECRLEVAGGPRRLEPDKRMAVFRIIQEALNNIRKHSEAPKAEVSIQFSDAEALIEVSDEGKGFDTAQCQGQGGDHLGITTMEERAYAIGGHLQISSDQGRGTRVLLWVPVSASVPADDASKSAALDSSRRRNGWRNRTTRSGRSIDRSASGGQLA